VTDQTPALPLFYRRPVPLDRARHARARLRRPTDLAFAVATNSAPVMIEEFALASREYPIVFAPGPAAMPLALLGLRDKQNLFMTEQDGAQVWRNDSYIPAYVRRYPFIFMEMEKPGDFTVCIDEAADNTDGDPIFTADGELSEAGTQAIGFCQAFQNQLAATTEFTAALKAQGLLKENTATIKKETGETINLTGFFTVDGEKFDALSDEVFLEWRRKGWLGLIYLHFASTRNWERLIAMDSRR
jgi:hypothetical protein